VTAARHQAVVKRGRPVQTTRASVVGIATAFGSATLLGQLCQLAWLVAASRALTPSAFGSVLAAQTLYGVLQYAADSGSALYGARLVAAGRLDDPQRAAIVRLRLQVAAVGVTIALAVGVVGGRDLLVATAPFGLALVLFAVLTYWERYGAGDSGPWSAYLVLRSAAPAAAAAVALALGRDLPLPAAGAAECVAIILVAVAFRLRPGAALASARSARPGPWRSVVAIGLPSLIWQLGLAFGTVVLGATGAAASAAALAVGIRLLTGLNQLTGVISTALFPRLAGEPKPGSADESTVVGLSVTGIVALAGASIGLLLAMPEQIVGVFLPHVGSEAQTTAILCIGAAPCASYVVLVTMVLVARGGESLFLPIFAFSTALGLLGGVGVVLADPESPAVWMAAVLLGTQVLTAALFERASRRFAPSLWRELRRGPQAAASVAAVSVLAATLPDLRTPLAVATLAVTSLLLCSAILSGLQARRHGSAEEFAS
jgi:O-antigen/teichoic acid export membrane protein